jgi:hypothetical protein
MAEPDVLPQLDSNRFIVKAVNDFHTEAQRAKEPRLRLNERNRQAYENLQDWAHKIEGQSKEFLPKTSETVDQMAAFVKRGLTQFGDWFQVSAENMPLSEHSIREMMKCFMENIPEGDDSISLQTRISDGVKVALLEAVMIFKVHGRNLPTYVYVEEGDTVVPQDANAWRLLVDLVPYNDFDEDPTGRNLYQIHSVERDLHDVIALAEQGVYDKAEVAKIKADFAKPSEEERQEEWTRHKPEAPEYRKRVHIKEFWGTILNDDGTVLHEKIMCTVANDKYLIRAPIPFPYWHGETPFVKIPLMRVPFTVHHKALYDQVVPINLALNELFNLMLDGGLAAVWGTRQVRLNYLEDPTQVAGGLPQGKTLAVTEDMPEGMKVVETVSTGEVPRESMAMYSLLDREFNASALTNDIKMGLLPPRQVKATEIVESQQSSAIVLDSLIADIERVMEKMLRKIWMTILQNTNDIMIKDISPVVPLNEIQAFAQLRPAERYAMFSQTCRFKVFGLSATLARARDFQKLMAIIQVASQSPLLLPAFLRKVSPDKLLDRMFKIMNMNPEDVQRDVREIPELQQDMQIFTAIQQAMQGASGQNVSTDTTGEPGLPSEINQEANPTSGL